MLEWVALIYHLVPLQKRKIQTQGHGRHCEADPTRLSLPDLFGLASAFGFPCLSLHHPILRRILLRWLIVQSPVLHI